MAGSSAIQGAEVERRARLSEGRADHAVHAAVVRALERLGAAGTVADIGCGSGELFRAAGGLFKRWIGIDAVRYDGLPSSVEFTAADLERGEIPLPAGAVDAALAVEVIEHLENPRAFVRELARITRPGGWIVVTTPNQLSALSLLTLVCKGQFSAFQDRDYPAHRTALLDVDLRRIAAEAGLTVIDIAYTGWGRIPLTGRHYPAALAALAPRRLSDNVIMAARR